MKLNIQRFAVIKTTTFSESNISIPNNTSSLTINIYFSANNSVTYFTNETLYCTCNGVTKSAKVTHSKGGSVSKSFTFDNIPHNSDGDKTVGWGWNCNTGTSVLGNVSASGYKALTKIARASAISFNPDPVELGQATTISLTRYIEDSYDILTFKIGETTGSIGTTDDDSFIWTPSITLANEITNSTSGVCEVTTTTYDAEDQLIASRTENITLEVPSSVVPSVSIGTLTEADTTMQSLNWGVFVQNKSKLNIPITATGIYGSTIQSIVTTINGLNFTGTPVTTTTLVTAGTNTITTTITDSRGRTATTTKTYNVESYSNPNIQIAQVQRCLSDGTLSDNGTYLLYDFKGSISPVSNNNTAIYKLGYKRTTDANYTYVTISTNYSVDINDTISSFTISADYPYDIKFTAEDEFLTAEIDRNIDTGFDLLNFNASGLAMAIGKVSEAGANEELLEVNLPTEFLQDIETQNIDAVDISANDIALTGDLTANDITSTSGSFTSISLNNNALDYKHIMTAKVDANVTQTISAGWTNYYKTLDSVMSSTGDKLTFENGRIKIGAGVSKVLVNLNACLRFASAQTIAGIYIERGGTEISVLEVYSRPDDSTNYYGMSISPILVDVEEGDEFGYYVKAGVTGTLTIAGNMTNLTVEVVK